MPIVLVVFDDELAATHSLRLPRREMERVGVAVPLRVSHKAALLRPGPTGRAWKFSGRWDTTYAFLENVVLYSTV